MCKSFWLPRQQPPEGDSNPNAERRSAEKISTTSVAAKSVAMVSFKCPGIEVELCSGQATVRHVARC